MSVEQSVSYLIQAIGLLIAAANLVVPYLGSVKLNRDISIYNGYLDLIERDHSACSIEASDLKALRRDIEKRLLFVLAGKAKPWLRPLVCFGSVFMIVWILQDLYFYQSALMDDPLQLLIIVSFSIWHIFFMRWAAKQSAREYIEQMHSSKPEKDSE